MSAWEGSGSWWVLAAAPGLAILAALAFRASRQECVWERLGRVLQALGLILALGLALRPERVVTTLSRRGSAVLLVDGSGSMQAPDADAAGTTRAAAASRLAQALRASLERQGLVLRPASARGPVRAAPAIFMPP